MAQGSSHRGLHGGHHVLGIGQHRPAQGVLRRQRGQQEQADLPAPDVNQSYYRFVPVDRKHIRYALGAIKGTGEAAVDHIVAVRAESGPFKDLFDFCRRTDKKIVNKRVIEALIRAGAFDSIEPNRAKLFGNVGLAMDAAEQEHANANQGGLFDMFGDDVAPAWKWWRSSPGTMRSSWRKKSWPSVSTCPVTLSPPTPRKSAVSSKRRYRGSARARSRSCWPASSPASASRWATAARWPSCNWTTRHQTGSQPVRGSFEANRSRLKDDVVLVIEGKVSEDNFSGGLRIIADKVYRAGRGAQPLRAQLVAAIGRQGRCQQAQGPVAPVP